MAGEQEELKFPEEEKEKVPEGFTEDEWVDLSDAEKEGVLANQKAEKDGEEEEEEKVDEAALKELAGETKTSEELETEKKAAEEAEVKKKSDEEAAAKKKAEEEAAKASGKTPEQIEADKVAAEAATKKGEEVSRENVSDTDLLRFRPVIADSELPALSMKRPPDVQAKIEELRKKLNDGDIDQAGYEDARDELIGEHTLRVNATREATRDNVTWEKEQARFFQARKEYLTGDGADLLYGALNAAIKKLSSNYDHMELLVEADRMVKKQFGKAQAPAVEPEKKIVEKPPAKLPDHKTLTDVPEAQRQTTESVFAALDKLRGEALESALERLTPAQKEAYEAGR
jgi:hypothetical protein